MPSFRFVLSSFFFFSLSLNVFGRHLSPAHLALQLLRKVECVIQRGEVPRQARIFGPTFPRVGLQTTDCQQRTWRVQSEPVGPDRRAALRSLTRVSFHPAQPSVLFPHQELERKPAPGSLLPAVAAPGGAEVACSLQGSLVEGTEKCK